MFGIHSSSHGKIIAIADIGSGSAGVAIAEVVRGKPVRIITSQRRMLSLEERPVEATAAGIISQLKESGEKARAAYEGKKMRAHISEVYVIVHAPWVRSKTVRAITKYEKQERITDKMIAELAQTAMATDSEIARDRLLEATVTRVELNGYPTASPKGKLAHIIEVFAILSDCDTVIQKGVNETLGVLFPGVRPIFRSVQRAILTVLKETATATADYVAIDISSEASYLMVVRDGATAEQLLVPEGTRSILRRISAGGLPEETLHLMKLIEAEECTTAACDALIAMIAKTEPELVRTYGEAMSILAKNGKLPNVLALVVRSELSDWLAKFFARIDFAQFTQTAQPFATDSLIAEDLAHLTSFDIDAAIDTGLALGAALVNIEKE